MTCLPNPMCHVKCRLQSYTLQFSRLHAADGGVCAGAVSSLRRSLANCLHCAPVPDQSASRAAESRGNISSDSLSDERNTWRRLESCVRACAGPLLRQALDHRRRRKSKPRTPPEPRNLAIFPPQAMHLTSCVCACYKKLLPTTRQSQRSSGIRDSL